MKSKLQEIYEKIIAEHDALVDIEPPCLDLGSTLIIPCEDGGYKILSEYVKDPAFTPVPKELLNEVCSKIKLSHDFVLKIPFREIAKKLKDYDYEYYYEFKENLEKRALLDGSLYVIGLLSIDRTKVFFFNKTFMFISSKTKDIEVSKAMLDKILRDTEGKDIDAFCATANSSSSEDAGFFNGNALVYLNLLSEFPKDSLEHELTHFVQRVVGFDKSLSIFCHNASSRFQDHV